MALRLNLYHEVERQKALKRRDPLKLSLYGLGAIALGMAAFYFVQVGVQASLAGDLRSEQAKYDRIKTKAEEAKKREEELTVQVKRSELLISRIEQRFYWAPVLQTITEIVPPTVQVTKVAGNVKGEALKKCTLSVEGISAGEEPRVVAEDLRKTLLTRLTDKYKNVSAQFRSLDDGKEAAKIEGRDLPTATFAIDVTLEQGEEPPPPPPPRKKA